MIRERTALEKRNKSMEESYYIYRTTWAEDWPQFWKATYLRDLFRERIQNKFEIFSLFYPLIGIAISFVIAIVVAIFSKKFLIGALAFVVLALLVVLSYSIFFMVLAHRVKTLNILIGHFYTKYGRKVMKGLYKKYGPDDLPPQPERYYNLNDDDEEEEEEEEKTVEEGGEPIEEAEKTEATDAAPAATDGIDLRLVKRDSSDTIPSSGDIIDDDNNPSGEAECEDAGDSSGKSEQILSEEAEGDEAVTAIDAESPTSTADDTDLSVQETYEDVRDEDVPDDFFVTDELETETIFGEDDQDKVPENSELTLADLFDDFSDEDYREESEEDIIEEKEENIVEETEETEELTENEEGGEENSRLFPEGYNPTIAELRAALRALSSYN